MQTVACVFVPGNGFTSEYVYRLRDAVRDHCRAPHRFVCLTNERLIGVEAMPIERPRNGWWNKLALFSAFEQAVYFDLDTMIVNDVTDIVTHGHRFTGLSDFSDKRPNSFASGFMAWNGDYSFLDQAIDKRTERLFDGAVTGDWTRHGDQGFIAEQMPVKPDLTGDLFPGRFVSYKWHVRRPGKVPEGASVVCFHGRPRPADIGWRLP